MDRRRDDVPPPSSQQSLQLADGPVNLPFDGGLVSQDVIYGFFSGETEPGFQLQVGWVVPGISPRTLGRAV